MALSLYGDNMHYEETLKLIEIIKSFDSDFIETLPSYISTRQNKKFSYQKKDNTIIFDMRIEILNNNLQISQQIQQHQHTSSPHTVTPHSVGVPIGPSIPSSVFFGNTTISTYNSMDELANNIKIVISAKDFSLISITWYKLKNNYVYAISSNHITTDEDRYGQQIMTALYLNNNKTIIDGVLYSPDENPDAFIQDIDNTSGISKLQILDLRDKYNE